MLTSTGRTPATALASADPVVAGLGGSPKDYVGGQHAARCPPSRRRIGGVLAGQVTERAETPVLWVPAAATVMVPRQLHDRRMGRGVGPGRPFLGCWYPLMPFTGLLGAGRQRLQSRSLLEEVTPQQQQCGFEFRDPSAVQ